MRGGYIRLCAALGGVFRGTTVLKAQGVAFTHLPSGLLLQIKQTLKLFLRAFGDQTLTVLCNKDGIVLRVNPPPKRFFSRARLFYFRVRISAGF